MLYYEQHFHCDKGVKLYIHSEDIINIEKNLEFTEKIIEMIREYNKSLMEGENMQTIELTKEEMNIIYDMRTKIAEGKNKKKYIENYIKMSFDYKKWLTKNDCSDDLGKFWLFLSEYENGRSRLLSKNIEDVYYGIRNILLESESRIEHLFNKG